MKLKVRQLIEQGNGLFSKKGPFNSLCQTIAENFYVERADFTTQRSIGMEFGAHLLTGYPAMCRRDLANQIGGMLRPRGSPWFHPRTPIERINKDQSAKKWLDWAGEVQRLAMYDTKSGFVRATREGDHDFATFGQAVIQVEPNRDYDGLLIRAWHLRDVVWSENADLQIDRIHRKCKLNARQLMMLFKGKVHAHVKEAFDKQPFQEFECQHIVVPAADYEWEDGKKGNRGLPYVSLYVDTANEFMMEETPAKRMGYVIPRWQTVSGSQYAYSPASVIAISDARTLQSMTLTLLEAGQKSVDPPLLAVGDAIQGGVNTFAGGITWTDAEYDERLGEALRPLTIDRGGFAWGDEREQKIREMISEAFYLNQLQMPETKGDMTAYETQKRVEEYIRRALPLFEPMETEYNGGLCNEIFDLMLDMGGFGNIRDTMPQILQGQDIRFTFESPLQAAQSRANSQAFMQTAQLLATAAQIDPTVKRDIDVDKAFRDAAEGAGAPADWFIDPDVANQLKQQDAQQAAQQQQIAQTMATVGAGADVAGKAGDAMQKIGGAMGMQAAPQGQQAA